MLFGSLVIIYIYIYIYIYMQLEMFKRPAAKRGNRPSHAGHPTVAAAAAKRVRINRPPSHSGCRGKRVSASDEAAAAATEAAEAAMAQAKELSMAMGVLAAENQDLKEQVIFERRRAETAEAALQQQQGTAEAAEAAQISLSQYCERRGAAEAAKVRAAPRDPPRSWR